LFVGQALLIEAAAGFFAGYVAGFGVILVLVHLYLFARDDELLDFARVCLTDDFAEGHFVWLSRR
jgi:hypothetical protein